MTTFEVLCRTLEEFDEDDGLVDGDSLKTILWAGRVTELTGQLACQTLTRLRHEITNREGT